MTPSGSCTAPRMPVSSAISRTAASSGVSSPSRCPFGRHHSRRPPRFRRAMTAAHGSPPSTVMTSPPAETSSTTGSGAGAGAGRERGSMRGAGPPGVAGTGGECPGPLPLPPTGSLRGSSARAGVDMSQLYRVRDAPPGSPSRAGAAHLAGLVAVPHPSSPQPTPAALELQRRALAVLAEMAPAAIELGEAFRAAGHELALVGGPVRDAFLGRASNDLDFATSASPAESEAILARWGDAHWDIGKEFGTIGAKRFGRSGPGDELVVAVTTYRSDEYDPASREPVAAFGDPLDGALSRRAFTVNAMAVRVPDMTFVDPFDGLGDLARRVLRTPIAPERSFDDDPLRMMRAARFAAQLGFDVDGGTLAALVLMTERIEIVSAERVRDELSKLLLAASPRRGLEVLVDTGLADHVLPELPALKLEID